MIRRECSVSGGLHSAFVLRCFVIPSFLIVLVGLAGCSSPPPPTPIPDKDAAPEITMTIVPGDEIEISFFGAPDLNITQAVRRDGKISLRLVDDVGAAGRTPQELQKEIAKLYASQLQIKSVTVKLLTAAPVFVTGSVLNPGRLDLAHPMTVLDAVMAVGGFDAREAEVRNVILIRHEDGKRNCYSFDFKPALNGEGADKSFYIKPFDIVYVPRTRIVKVDQWVDQHINRIIPQIGIGYSTSGEVTFYR
jgi:protein involved in polysaccharide export with SLBB domain